MDTPVTGIHHITLCPGGAQADVDFFTAVLGQRLVVTRCRWRGTVRQQGKIQQTVAIVISRSEYLAARQIFVHR